MLGCLLEPSNEHELKQFGVHLAKGLSGIQPMPLHSFNYASISSIALPPCRIETGRPLRSGTVVSAGMPRAWYTVAQISDVVANPQLRHRNQIIELDVPAVGKIPMHGLTIGLSGTPGSIRRPPPKIGEHTEEVLADWAGYGSDKIAAYPTDHPVRPEDLIATVYCALGIPDGALLYDSQKRPHRATEGEPLVELFG